MKVFFTRYIVIITIILNFITKCIQYDIKIGIFVSNELASKFYKEFRLQNDTFKDDYLKSFIMSSYSYGLNKVFMEYGNYNKGHTLNVYTTYVEVIDAIKELEFLKFADFCNYQAALPEKTWNIAFYLKDNTVFTMPTRKICTPTLSCAILKEYFTFTNLYLRNGIYYSSVYDAAFQINTIVAAQIGATNLARFYSFIETGPEFKLTDDIWKNFDTFFTSNRCNDQFSEGVMLKSFNLFAISKLSFCQTAGSVYAIATPDAPMVITQEDNECYFLNGVCSRENADLINNDNSFRSILYPGASCVLNDESVGKCLSYYCVSSSEYNRYYSDIPTTTTTTTTTTIITDVATTTTAPADKNTTPQSSMSITNSTVTMTQSNILVPKDEAKKSIDLKTILIIVAAVVSFIIIAIIVACIVTITYVALPKRTNRVMPSTPVSIRVDSSLQ